jgi:predicted aconitase
MLLTDEEKSILDGSQGEVMAKIMKTVVEFGDTFEAERLVPLTHGGHLVTSFGLFSLDPVYDIMDQIIAAGIKTPLPFTVDPRPYDFENGLPYDDDVKQSLQFMYSKQDRWEQQLLQVGLKDGDSFSCASYLPEGGNTPNKGDVLAWSESSAAVFSNSVLGARTNRNSGVIDLFCNILGKAPLFGLLTDEGRKAEWLVEVRTSQKPNPQLLGSAIGIKVVADVPYVTGLDKFLGTEITDSVRDYLKDMGAAAATNGAVGLYYVENLTPTAKDMGRSALKDGYKTFVVDDAVLERTLKNYPVLWKNPEAQPVLAFIGVPHLSLSQIYQTVDRIAAAVEAAGRHTVRITTVLTSAPKVIAKFKEDKQAYQRLLDLDLHLSFACPLMHMNNPVCAAFPTITNSNKLRTYTTARFFLDDDVVRQIVHGDGSPDEGQIPAEPIPGHALPHTAPDHAPFGIPR